MKRLIPILIIFASLCVSCTTRQSSDANHLIVSIQPLKYLVDRITGDDFVVEVLVPPGASPETYEPTPGQLKSAETARLVFSTGLIDFEQELLGKIADKDRFVNLSEGVVMIEGACSHAHDHDSGHGAHFHGVDPHIWTAPQALMKMAETAYGRIHELYPDSLSYFANYSRLKDDLEELDEAVKERVAASGRRAFVIFHPGLTYYARDYGLRQISLEHEGKEPSARQLRGVVELARTENISKVLYQSEFPLTMVEVAAEEIGATAVEIDILGYDVIDNILKVTELILSE